MKIQFNLTFYAKVLLHASKYPHKAVNGVLLSKFEKGSDVLQIVDVIPLFHQCLVLAPMLEVALSQVKEYFQWMFCEIFNMRNQFLRLWLKPYDQPARLLRKLIY